MRKSHSGLVLVVCLAASAPLPASEFRGTATPADGDSIRIAGRTMDLSGIDAPELLQYCREGTMSYPCGRRATEFLASLVQGAEVSCRRVKARHSADKARCKVRGKDISEILVRSGHAIAVGPSYSRAEYAARGARAGIWAGYFMRPEQWRRRMASTSPIRLEEKTSNGTRSKP